MYTLTVYDSKDAAIIWFTGTRANVTRMRSLWTVLYAGCRIDVQPPMPQMVMSRAEFL